MRRIIHLLEDTMNKSTIDEFRTYLNNLKRVTKWTIMSDYCFYDKNKAQH